MKSNPDIERVYELLEQHDFNELSEEDKNQVLSIMTEKEYMMIAAGDMYCRDRNVYLQAVEK